MRFYFILEQGRQLARQRRSDQPANALNQQKHHVHQRVRQTLSLLDTALAQNYCAPGFAGAIRGIAAFLGASGKRHERQ
jgi:hypothetical protein